MGTNELTENTPNAPKFVCPTPKVWDFHEKRLHMASVVRALNATKHRNLIWAKKRFMRSNDIEKVLKDQIKKVNHVLTKLNVNLGIP